MTGVIEETEENGSCDEMYFNFKTDLKNLEELDLVAILKHYLKERLNVNNKDGPVDVVIGNVKNVVNVKD